VISGLGVWKIESLQFKVYGIVADGQEVSDIMLKDAHTFTSNEVLPIVEKEGCHDGLGFAVIHPGDLGVSFLAHWWVQGSILCQHIQRTEWHSSEPMNMSIRPVVACVWELGLINAEQLVWRDTMMGSTPDPEKYLSTRASITVV